MVGASADEQKAAFRIPEYLQQQGYRIRPVNPRGGTILGEPAVEVSPRWRVRSTSSTCSARQPKRPDVARQAVAIGAKVLWLQLGVTSDEARAIAEEAGLTVVMDRCMGATHRELGLGPLPPDHLTRGGSPHDHHRQHPATCQRREAERARIREAHLSPPASGRPPRPAACTTPR